MGKTCFVQKLANGRFVSKYNVTKGAEVTSFVLLLSDQTCVKFDLWDTAGGEKNSLRDVYYVGANGALLMYDVTSKCKYVQCNLISCYI